MIYPKFLEDNSTLGIPAPSAGAGILEKQAKILNAKKNLEQQGFKTVLSNNIMECEHGRSGTAIDRANEINYMFENHDIDFILCAMGGEFLVEILPYINFDLIKGNPKIVAGFSDPTALLYPITTKYDIATIYGQNFSAFGMNNLHESQLNFLNICKGNIFTQNNFEFYEEEAFPKITGLEEYNLTEKVYWKTLDNNQAHINGRIIGGCFDLIAELVGTKYDGINEFNEKYKEDGIIWYFDNCEISMEETIRILWRMNEFNYFKYTKGVIFGRFGENITICDYDVKKCLQDSILSKLNIPIIYDVDISHKPPCLTIINGAIAEVNVKEGKGDIAFYLK